MKVELAKNSYREVLLKELGKRQTKNPGYSQRAFARDIGIRSNRLSEILNGKQGISVGSANLIGEKLNYSPEQKQYFCNLVRLENKKASQSERNIATAELQDYSLSKKYHEVGIDSFKLISEWHHLAILEMTKLSDFERDPSWIATRLFISKDEAIEAVLRLKRLGMLEEKNQSWSLPSANNNVPGGISSEAVKKFHEQVLSKARSALYRDRLEEREFRSTFIAVKKDDLNEAKQRINQFWKAFDEEFGVTRGGDEVYNLGVQFFKVSGGKR